MFILKQICVFLLLAISATGLGQQATISLLVSNYADRTVTYTPPTNGMAFWAAKKEIKLSAKGETVIKIALKKSGPLYITLHTKEFKSYTLYIQPKGHYIVRIDAAKEKDNILIEGKNNAGNTLLNKISFPYYYFSANTFKKDSSLQSAAAVEHRMDSLIIAGIAPYKKLLSENKIDREFYTFASTDLRYYYALVIANVISNYYYQTTYNEKDPDYLQHMPEGFSELWNKIYQKYPVHNTAALSFQYFRDYAIDNYLQWYKPYLLAHNKVETIPPEPKTFDEEEMLAQKFTTIKKYFKGDVLEALLAQEINYTCIQEKFQKTLITAFKDFEKTYPKSQFLEGLQQSIVPTLAYYKKIEHEFSEDQKIIPGYEQADSLSQVLTAFKGKVVFIDVWATWCGPCKVEFKYKDSLEHFLKEQGVDMLYLSLDDLRYEKKWKEMIKYYGLSGNHIRVNPGTPLYKNLTDLFDQKGSISIPWYLIIDKSGNIVQQHAKRPSDGEALYAQIKETVNK